MCSSVDICTMNCEQLCGAGEGDWGVGGKGMYDDVCMLYKVLYKALVHLRSIGIASPADALYRTRPIPTPFGQSRSHQRPKLTVWRARISTAQFSTQRALGLTSSNVNVFPHCFRPAWSPVSFSCQDYGLLRFDHRVRNLGSGGFGTVSVRLSYPTTP